MQISIIKQITRNGTKKDEIFLYCKQLRCQYQLLLTIGQITAITNFTVLRENLKK